LFADHLRGKRHPLGHCEIERELYGSEMVVLSGDSPCRRERIGDREVLGMLWRGAQTVPRRQPPGRDFARRHSGFERLDSRREASKDLRAIQGDFLRFDVVEIVEIDRYETQVLQASLDLILQILGGQAMPSLRDLGPRRDPRLDESLENV